MFIGHRLATRRRALDLSRAEFGRLVNAGASASTIADYESGVRSPDPVGVLGLARVLACEPRELFSAETDPLCVQAVELRQRWRAEDEAAPDIPDVVIERLRQLLPVPASSGRTAATA